MGIRKWLGICAAALGVFASGCAVSSEKSSSEPSVGADGYAGAFILDVRTGEEFAAEKAVGLFDKDDNFGDAREDWQAYLKLLRQMKRQLPLTGEYRLDCRGEEFVVGKYNAPDKKVRGVFSMMGSDGDLAVDLPDGLYRDLVDGREVVVSDGFVHTDGEPVIIAMEEDK